MLQLKFYSVLMKGVILVIKVYVGSNRIRVQGHANAAPKGQDIVCAAVSALTLTLIRGLKDIACMTIYEEVEPGNVCIKWQKANDTGKVLIDTWFLGMCAIVETCKEVDIYDDGIGRYI